MLYISSIVAVEATAAPLPYSAAKAALNNYAKNLARQLGAQKVRVNTIAPGNILFPGRIVGAAPGSSVADGRSDAEDRSSPAAVWDARGDCFAGCYLCSEAAGFSTGACYVMDGGQTRAL